MGGGFLMFGLGALTAWTYMRHEHETSGCPYTRPQAGQQPANAGPGHGPGNWGGWPRWQWQRPLPPSEVSQQRPVDAAPPPISMQQRDWETLQALGRHAGDRMSEMSETTLDSLIDGLRVLKTRIGEHRAQQEMQQQAVPGNLRPVSPPSPPPS